MRSFSETLARFFSQYLPDALSFSLILTLFVFAAALIFTSIPPLDLLGAWGDSLWNLHTFAMQMVLILLFGHLLAQSPMAQRILSQLSRVPQSEGSAVVWLVVLSSFACWLNWGFGLMSAAALAISFKQRFPRLHFGFLLATGYAGFLVWHGGLSGSIPLSIAGEDKILSTLGLQAIPLSVTIFSAANIFLVLTLILTLALTAFFMRTTSQEENLEFKPSVSVVADKLPATFTERLQNNVWVLRSLALVGFVYLGFYFFHQGSFHINSLNLIFFFLVLLSYGSVKAFSQELEKSVRVVGPILIQYPLYAGIMGMIQTSGLGELMSQFFLDLSTPATFPLFTFLSAGLVNFFVPSGGGQWVIQGPIMLKAAVELKVPVEKVVMAIAWGDAWTNLVQPFWALPLLSMARMELKDIMSYCVVYLLVSGVVISGFMLI